MEKVVTFVRGCVTIVNSVSNALVALVATLLDLNYRVVSVLASLGSFLYGLAYNLVCDFFSIVQCLVEDFVIFAVDVVSSTDRLLNAVSAIIYTVAVDIYGCVQDVGSAVLCVLCLPYTVLLLIYDCVLTVSGLLAYVGCVVKDYLVLTSSSVILLFMLIPYTIIALYGAVVTAISALHNASVQFMHSSIANLKHLGTLISTSYNDLSYDAIIGLVFIILMCFTCYRLPRLLRNCHVRLAVPTVILNVPSALCQVLKKIRNLLTSYWRSLSLRRARNQVMHGPCTNASMSADCLQEQLSRELENKLCVVCQDAPKSIILLPCRHVCVCHSCRMTLLQNGSHCPMCRTHVRESMHVFL